MTPHEIVAAAAVLLGVTGFLAGRYGAPSARAAVRWPSRWMAGYLNEEYEIGRRDERNRDTDPETAALRSLRDPDLAMVPEDPGLRPREAGSTADAPGVLSGEPGDEPEWEPTEQLAAWAGLETARQQKRYGQLDPYWFERNMSDLYAWSTDSRAILEAADHGDWTGIEQTLPARAEVDLVMEKLVMG